jgi:SAM-dependent methyltransferase
MARELLTSAAAERNKAPILAVLESVLPASGRVLEIASGTGQHVCFFAAALPGLRWLPSEPETAARESMITRIRESALTNIDAPVALDVHEPRWPVAGELDAIVCINMIHISPWSATLALCAGAARHLRAGGVLVTYGPYLENGTAAPSNLDFDASLKRRNAEWGLRDLDEVTRVAGSNSLTRRQVARLPANNLGVVFEKTA